MSSQPRLSRLATDALARATAAPRAPTAADEARAIDAIAKAIGERARARRRRRVVGGALAVAACVAGLFGAAHLRGPSETTAIAHAVAGNVVVVREGRSVSLEEHATTLARGDRLVAPAGARASVVLATGTHLSVDEGADLAVQGLGPEQRFLLSAGSVHADVAKLARDERFLVRTVDAEVEVRGTSFGVAIVGADPACGNGARTRVVVSEGVVVVRAGGAESRVAAGESWPAGCARAASAQRPAEAPSNVASSGSAYAIPAPIATPTPIASVTTTAALTPTVTATPTAIATTTRTATATGTATATATATATTAANPAPTVAGPPPDIVEQNRILSDALDARRRGALAEAVSRYDVFLSRFPNTQAAETATVERMRVLASMDRARGAAAARGYLARYPQGFARAEAAQLAAPP